MWDRGLRSGDHVAIFMENHLRYFEVVWAALRSGLYITTVNSHLTGEEAAYIVDNCEAKVLVASHALAAVAALIPQHAPNCHTLLMVEGTIDGFTSYEEAITQHPAQALKQEPSGQFMLYSSGTTGRPKGIRRPVRKYDIAEGGRRLSTPHSSLWQFDENSIYLSPAPLYHSGPIGFCIATQALGGTVVMMPEFDEREAMRAIEDFGVTHSQWVPTMFTRLLKLPEKVRCEFALDSHRIAVHAAAPCPRAVKQKMLDWWGPIIYELYGGTEANGGTHVTPEEWLARPGTVGKPMLGVIHICDDEGIELPVGEAGLIYFEHHSRFEYFKDRDKTEDAQHPQHPNWTSMGDIGYVDEEGYLYLTDRASFMIISGGVNIYPQEIEDTLIMHPKVADVAIVGAPNTEMGEEVKAVVEVADHVAADCKLADELIAYTREHIAHYKCPKSVDFVDKLPRQPTGKLYKRLIKDRYWGNEDSRIV